MKKYVDGKYIDMTFEEIEAIQIEIAKAEAAERHRPMTEYEITTLFLRQNINALEVDDQTAVRMTSFYPEWQTGVSYTAGYKVQCNGKLCRCIQSHTSQEGWQPESASSLWEYINEEYTGDLYDPIPYDGNMALETGKYYTQDGVIYLCNRDTINPVYNALSELVGLYVDAV
jgi:hypothetical protein